MAGKRAQADAAFRQVGITFAVYGDDAGTERLIPFDLIPRVIPSKEWATLQKGLIQRVQALNMFIHDVYHNQNIIKAGVVPAEQIFLNAQYRPQMQGVEVAGNNYCHIAGVDIVRAGQGEFYVMRLIIKHNTHYHYDDAPKHLIQLLRLTPRLDAHQRVVDWRVSTPGKQTAFTDAFGNPSQSHVVNPPQSDLNILVEGTVDLTSLVDGVLGHEDTGQAVPTIAYMVPTSLTAGFSELDAFASDSHCRLAIGCDYLDACPIRGI